MKYLLTLFLITATLLAFGQGSIDFQNFINSWTQGKIEPNGKVIQADVNRGGWYELIINSDATVILRDPLACGFGHERQGKWIFNKIDTAIVFTFSKRIGYMNSPGTDNINEMEIYKIEKLTMDELILTGMIAGEEKTMYFIKTKK